MKQTLEFKIDLTKIEGEGEFTCPRCGQAISPDAEPGETYEIVDYAADGDGSTEEIVIRCERCMSTLHIGGFELLKDLGINDAEQENEPQDAKPNLTLDK